MQDAFAAARAAQERRRVNNTDAAERAERYFFFAGDEPGVVGFENEDIPNPGGMMVASRCIAEGVLRRCDVTPCLTMPIPSRPEEIPEGMRIAGSYDDRTKKMQYWLFAGPEAQSLIESYGNAGDVSKQYGLVELVELRGKSLEEVESLQIRQIFFPSWPDVPESNTEVTARIKSVIEDVQTNPAIPSDLRGLYLSLAARMLTATDHAQSYQSNIVASTNMRVTLASDDEKFKREFDTRDYLFSKRTGTPLAFNALRGNQSDILAQVLDRMAPQQFDPSAIAAIVATTMKAMRELDEPPKRKPLRNLIDHEAYREANP